VCCVRNNVLLTNDITCQVYMPELEETKDFILNGRHMPLIPFLIGNSF
jgi:hypothetical protein